MPFQPPSILAACMILLAAPKLAASFPSADPSGTLAVREDDPVPIIEEEEDTQPVPTPIYTPSGSVTPVEPPEPEIRFAFQGCYAEPKKNRALSHVWVHDSMTPELCASHAEGFAYYGVEYGKECWYGDTLRKGSTQKDDEECSMRCPGDLDPDSTQTCGGGMRLNLWRRTDAFIPLDQPEIGNYKLQGCYVDTLNPRALRHVLGDDNMTPQLCSDFCAGSTYMGLEYGRECWCDDVLDITSFKATLDDCQMPCAGDLSSMCGSPNRMDLYKLNSPAPADQPYYDMGCYVDTGAVHRALPELYADDNMSWDMCAGFAARRGFKHFGVEFGRECWAGHQIDSLAYPSGGCGMPCSGNDAQDCGGRERLRMFTYDASDVSSVG